MLNWWKKSSKKSATQSSRQQKPLARWNRTQLHLEALEGRIVPAVTLFVNDNWFIANDVAPGGLSNGDTVDNRNDTGGSPTVTKTFGTDAFSTIQAALNASSNGDTINVLQGTYNELLTVSKSVALVGANAGVHPAVGANTAATVGVRGPETILSHNGFYSINPQAANITIDGFDFTGVGSRVIDAASGNLPNLHIANNIFANTGTSGSSGVIQLDGGGNITNLNIEFNLFQNRGVNSSNGASSIYTGLGDFTGLRIANNKFNVDEESVFEGGSTPYVNAVVANNEFDGTIAGVPGAGDPLMNIGMAGNISVRENAFHDMGGAAFQLGINGGEIVRNTFTSASNGTGVVQLWGGEFGTFVSTNVDIANNVIHFNDSATVSISGVRLRPTGGGSAIDGTTIHIHNNTFINGGGRTPAQGAFAIRHNGDPTKPVDASGNWWSTTSDAAILALMSGPVDFTPYLDSGTDGAGVGFQGDFSTLDVTALGSQIGGNNRVAEGYGDVTANGTVNVRAGTYSEGSFEITKGVTFNGPNAAISPNIGSRVAEAIINGAGGGQPIRVSTASAVNFNGLTINTTQLDSYFSGNLVTFSKDIISNLPGNVFYFEPATWTLSDNHIFGTADDWDDALIAGNWNGTTGTMVNIQNNVIENLTTASTSSGLNLSNVAGTISGNTFRTKDFYAILLANNSGVTVSGNTFDGIYNSTGFQSYGALRFYQPATVTVSITSNLFKNSYDGIAVRQGAVTTGASISIATNTFTNNTYHIINLGNGGLAPAGDNIFDGVTLSAATTAQLFAIADKVVDAVDVPDAGLVRLKAGNIYVTPNSFFNAPSPNTATTAPSIQRAVDAATSGNVVNIQAGTYTGNVDVNKAVTLAPEGNSGTGLVTNTGTLAFSTAGAAYAVNLNGITVGTGYDRITATSTVDLANPSPATLSVSDTLVFPALSVFDIVTSPSPIVDQFSGLPNGATVTTANNTYKIFYNPGANVVRLIKTSATSTFANTYVNEDWAALPDGTVLTGQFAGHVIGVDAFATLQKGHDALLATGGTLTVAGSGSSGPVNGDYAGFTLSKPNVILQVVKDTDNNETTATITSAVALGGFTLTVTLPAAAPLANLIVSGAIGGAGNLVFNDAGGTVTLSGANSYSGSTALNSGTLKLGAAGVLPDTTTLTVAGGATLDLNGNSEAIDALNGGGTVTGTSGTPTFTVGSTHGTGSFSGTLQNGGGTVALVKAGNGTETLSGTLTYTGTTTINGGTLTLATSLSGAGGAVQLNAPNVTLNGGSVASVINGRAVVVTALANNNATIQGFHQITNGAGQTGIDVFGAASITNNIISGNATGIKVENGGFAGVSGDAISSPAGGTGIYSGAIGGGGGGTLSFGAGDTITGGATGLVIDGINSAVIGFTLNNLAFSSLSGDYIDLLHNALIGPQVLDASAASFEGVVGQNLPNGQFLTTEARLHHYPQDNGVGLIVLKTKYAYMDNGNLFVIGTSGVDTIVVNTTTATNVTVQVNGTNLTNPAGGTFQLPNLATNRAIIFGLAGNDMVQAPGYRKAEIHGGDGNDRLYGGSADDALFGDGGDDLLVGNDGNDILIGGLGRDTMQGGNGADVMVSGRVDGTAQLYDNLRLLADNFAANSATSLTALAMATYDPNNDPLNVDQLSGGAGADGFVMRMGQDLATDFTNMVDQQYNVTNP